MITDTEARTRPLRALHVNRLVGMAECASPDGPESPGAKFLDSVRDGVIEAIKYDDQRTDWSDAAAEIADGAPDVYTHTMWSEFLDLAAYNEDPTELGAEADDMDKCARICLYMIAERLARALFDLWAEIKDDTDA